MFATSLPHQPSSPNESVPLLDFPASETPGSSALNSMDGGSVETGSFSRFNIGDLDDNDVPQIHKILPQEVLLHVFSFLDVVSLCRCAQVRVLVAYHSFA